MNPRMIWAAQYLEHHGWNVTPPPSRNEIYCIQEEVCAKYGVNRLDMLSHKRPRHLIRARHEAIRRARRETFASFPELGRAFNRDHTSIMYVVRGADGDF